MYAWQFSKALYLADRHGWTRFVSMQDHYNLLNREEEREMHPLCVDQEVAVIPWSPLARGRLTRQWATSTERTETDEFGKNLHVDAESDRQIVERVGEVAQQRGVSMAQVALAWMSTRTWSQHPSSERADVGTWRMPSLPCTWS
jgi:aryl-alcohol dehydrogenase (NADP+)